MLSRTLTAGLAAAAVAMATAGTASAGSYHVYSCRTPAGEAAPADGWSGVKTGTSVYVENTCQQAGGSLVAALGPQAGRRTNTAQATWAFTAPPATKIAGATLWRAGDAAGGAAVNATYEFWLAAPTETGIFDECLYALGCSSLGNPAVPTSSANRVEVPTPDLGSQLYAIASCGGLSEYKCKEGFTDANGYAAVVYVYAADITLEQAAGPTAQNVGGELANAGVVSGTSDITFQASDPGAGVYEATFAVDGQVVERTRLDENGGRCRNAGQTSDGSPAFLYVQPCLASLSADVGLDTTRFANGPHHVVVSVLDAAGNQASVIDRNVTIANPVVAGAGASAAGLGLPNGTNASAKASLTVAWKGAKGTRLTSGFGHAQTVAGRLTAPGGAPIAGAVVAIVSTAGYQGARAVVLAPAHTGADGRFTVRAAPGDSRTLRFSYSARTGEAAVVSHSLVLTVRAAITLTIAPRTASVGRQIHFKGRLLGGPVPAGGKLLVLEARSPGGPWIEFHVARSARDGRYAAGYTFRLPGPHTYQFRVVCEHEADYPYAAGASRVIGVLEL